MESGIREPACNDHDRPDAVCFCSGIPTAAFGAGSIHAYLASGRRPPLVVAGISLGALNAAAMQRCYQEVEKAKSIADPRSREAARWRWFRKYLKTFTHDPFDFVWDSIPGISDFVADLPPVSDTSAEGPFWSKLEAQSRKSMFLKARLGIWLAHLPVRISWFAGHLVAKVRWHERYTPFQIRIFNCVRYGTLFWASLLWHFFRSPQWIPEYNFREYPFPGVSTAGWVSWLRERVSIPPYRPLFGWPIWAFASISFILIPSLILLWIGTQVEEVTGYHFFHQEENHNPYLMAFGFSGLILAWAIIIAFFGWMGRIRDKARRNEVSFWQAIKSSRPPSLWSLLLGELVDKTHLRMALLDDFQLRRKLYELFREDDGESPFVGEHPMPALFVTAPLQILNDSVTRQPQPPRQLWASNKVAADRNLQQITIEEALRAALTMPGVFEPMRQNKSDRFRFINPEKSRVGSDSSDDWGIDLVDGAVIRHNPLPALFDFLDEKQNKEIADQLTYNADEAGDSGEAGVRNASVHLIYGVPILPKLPDENPPLRGTPGSHRPDVVTAMRGGIRLARRRDSRFEVWRTNRISRLECQIKSRAKILPIFVDEIAPQKELGHGNALKPVEREVYEHFSAGCRATLSMLYKDRLPETDTLECHVLMSSLGAGRHREHTMEHAPGLPEVCLHCTRKLQRPPSPPDSFLAPSFRDGSQVRRLAKRFPYLTGEEPRIILGASGGVFRGAFHVGVIAALASQHIRPDMIAGASVGTLLGATLGAVFLQPDYAGGLDVLARLTGVFLQVDKTVALTKTLKTAARDLGQRGRAVKLSPDALRRMVLSGGKSDAGYAATGAPPALIDAISHLFLIPHRKTAEITAEFVAGHIEEAVREFLVQLRHETITRLGVRNAIIGGALLELSARRLLGKLPAHTAQPFHCEDWKVNPQIAFFATAVNLTTEVMTVLGTDRKRQTGSYDFVRAALASSAFPGVFAPVGDNDIYSGLGDAHVFFGDGGMFDNLPFIPATEILGEVQKDYRKMVNEQAPESLSAVEFLRRRAEAPDLLLVGSLSARPGSAVNFDNVVDIWDRGSSLGDNDKIDSFQSFLRIMYSQIDRLANEPENTGPIHQDTVDNAVSAAILAVFPATQDHLNGTFHFCRSMGLSLERVGRSMADGCFQTLTQLAHAEDHPNDPILEKSVSALRKNKRLPYIVAAKGSVKDNGFCPFFLSTAIPSENFTNRKVTESNEPGQFRCPFHEAGIKPKQSKRDKEIQSLFRLCKNDANHRPSTT